MTPTVRNILAVLVGLIVGNLVNMGLIMLSGSIIPPPEGVVTSDLESIKSSIHLYETKHFIMPFLAHALGTLVAAFLAAKIAATHKMTFALVFGGLFFLGGLMMVIALPEALTFGLIDLALAYFPMAYIGGRLGGAGPKKQ